MKRIFALAALLLAGVVHGQAYKQFYPGCALTGTWNSQTVNLNTGACVAGNLPPTNLNSGTGANSSTFWRGDGTWATPPGTGGGTVNSVALTAPSVFSVAGSPITNSGTLALTFATGQTANEFLATPDGTTGAVGLRAIVAGDLLPINLASSANGGVTGNLPVTNLNAGTSASNTTFWRGDGTWATPSGATGTVQSVALSDGSTSPIYSISGSPVTTTGTLTFTLATETAHFALLGPTSGSPAQPTFRAIAGGDLPAINLAASGAGGVTGNLPVGNLNSGTSATGSTFWRGDGTWAVPPGGGGTVTSVAQTVPTGFAISGSPITGAGTLGISYATGQSANLFLATPNGTTGALSERAIVGADLPAINLAASGAGGVTGNLSVNNLNGGTSAGSTTFWRGDGTWATPGYPTGANPSASVGLTAINGSAATFMRSDGAPALSQSIAPTWTGNHTFTPTSGGAISINSHASGDVAVSINDPGVNAQQINISTTNTESDISVTGTNSILGFFRGGVKEFELTSGTTITGFGSAITGGSSVNFNNTSTVSGDFSRIIVQAGSENLQLGICNQNQSTLCKLTGGPTTASAWIETFAAIPLAFGTGNAYAGEIGTSNGLVWGSPTGGDKGAGTINATGLFVNGSAVVAGGSFTGTLTGLSTTVTTACNYSIAGQLVTVSCAAATGTSNNNTLTMTGLPAAIQPTASVRWAIFPSLGLFEDNSVLEVTGSGQIGSGSGTITFGKCTTFGCTAGIGQSSWTTSGTKGFWDPITFMYQLN